MTVVVCLVSKVSPYGKYGAKMHALMTCPCERCIRQRELTIQGKLNCSYGARTQCQATCMLQTQVRSMGPSLNCSLDQNKQVGEGSMLLT